ncbi:excinuclease ABC subunit C [Burkholderia arboris]|uniref:Excinuclease ABC subunit C n=1 Tax=Burkholderia arboris TaxID=488730 RepID=A0A9Q9SIZ2_9BURK|nr:GIY-YIG nuclease family protein [Burkholderia arboris]VWB70105.1 excinuclease ABC subunit C [Burkholderia arboris]
MSWFLYLIECADDSVYTGITTDVAARFDEHASGKGARYTRSRKPRAVLASFPLPDRSSASRAEYWVKRLTPVQKRELAAGLRTLESVLPVVVPLDESEDPAGLKAGTRRRKKVQTETADDTPQAVATTPVAGKNVKTGQVAKSAKPAKGKQASKTTKAVPDTKREKTGGDAVVKKTASRRSPVKKTRTSESASSKKQAPAAAGKPVANAREDTAPAPARRRASATKAVKENAPSVAPRRAKRTKGALAAPPPPPSTPARKKPARTKQNRAAS